MGYLRKLRRKNYRTGGSPVFTLQPEDQTAVFDPLGVKPTATFTSLAIGGIVTYQWQLNSGSGFANVGGATSASYTTGLLELTNDGDVYQVIATNDSGSTTSEPATLSVDLLSEPDWGFVPSVPAGSAYTQSLKFAASNETRAEAATVPAVTIATDYTIVAWVKTYGTDLDATLVNIGDGTDRHGLWTDNAGALGAGNYDGTYDRAKGTDGSVVAGTWYHLALVNDTGAVTVYVDGAAVAEIGGGVSIVATALTMFGCRSAGVVHVDAYLSDVKVYDEALTEARIDALVAFTDDTTGLSSRWPFDGDYVDTISARNGTAYNFTPAFSVHPLDVSVQPGLTTTFTCAAGPNATFQWQRDTTGVGDAFANIAGETGTSFTTEVLEYPSDNGDLFKCVATNAEGSTDSNTATLTVIFPEPLHGFNPDVPAGSPFSESLRFEAGLVDTIVNSTAQADVLVAGTYTLMCWVKPTVLADAVIFSVHNGTNDRHGIYLESDGALGGMYYDGSYTQKRGANSSVSADTWYHVALVNNGGTITVYVDGTSVSTASGDAVLADTAGCTFGAQSVGVQDLDGYISDVRIYDEVLSEARIDAIIALGEDTTGLVAQWTFDGDPFDPIGFLHGTPTNFTTSPPTIAHWVDVAWGGTESGTEAQPYNTIGEAIAAASANEVIAIRGGSYHENSLALSTAGITLLGQRGADGVPTVILEPLTAAITWATAFGIGPGVYSTTDIVASPEIVSYAGKSVFKLGDQIMETDTGGNYDEWGWRVLESSDPWVVNGLYSSASTLRSISPAFNFWDCFYSCWAQDGSTTYFKHKAGTDPDTLAIVVGPANSEGLRITAANCTVDGLLIRGFSTEIEYTSTAAISLTIKNSRLTNYKRGLRLTNGAAILTFDNNYVSSQFDTRTPGAWADGNTTSTAEKEAIYLGWKYVYHIADTASYGLIVSYGGDSTVITNNTFTEGAVGLTVSPGAAYPDGTSNLTIANNTISNMSSVGVTFQPGQVDTNFYQNAIVDCAIQMRFHAMDANWTGSPGTSVYIYDNQFYLPEGVGQHNRIHFNAPPNATYGTPEFYVMHNSFSGGRGFSWSAHSDTYTGIMGEMHYLNNVYSCVKMWDANINSPSAFGTFDYCWFGGQAYERDRNDAEPWFGASNIDGADDTYVWPLTIALTQLSIDGDSATAPSAAIEHDAGTGAPFWSHCADAPDGLSADWVSNDNTETSGTAWFTLSAVDADLDWMSTLNIDVDVEADAFNDDTCVLTARIYDSATATNPLTDESATLGSHADTTRTQRNVVFTGVVGTAAQWATAQIRFTWTYAKTGGPDNDSVRLYGVSLDGTYVPTVPQTWVIPVSHAAEDAALDIFDAPFTLTGKDFDFTAITPATADPRDMGAMTI